MAEFFDADGNVVEAFTSDEVEEKIEEAKEERAEEIKAEMAVEIEESKERIESLEDEVKSATEALEKGDDKAKNFGNLRRAKEAAEKELEDFKKNTTEKLSALESKMSSKDIDDQSLIMAEGDKSLADKISFYYKGFQGEPKDAKERDERFKNALLLANGGESNYLPGNIISGAGGTPTPAGNAKGKISEEAKGVARNLGITDEELKASKLI